MSLSKRQIVETNILYLKHTNTINNIILKAIEFDGYNDDPI